MRLFALMILPALAIPTVAQDLVAKTDALSPAEELKKFKLPEGFTAQLVAAEPDIQKPMQMAFDAIGRLWVTTSHHYPWAVEPGKGTDKLFVLSDFDANGRAKKVQVFDDKLNIPIGVLPLPDCKSVIVSECGKILKLIDTNGDLKADQREVLFEGFGYKDTHGMTNSFTLLPDGWVYACHGFANDSKVKGKDGHEVVMNSGHTFRFRPDGSRIEIFTRGQVNPFGMCIDPWLNLYTADCHSKPMTQLIQGAYYDSFGKPHDGLGYAPHVINHLHGSTGLCGLVYYSADQFPKEWNGVMFVGNCVTNRVNCDRIVWKGATPVGKEMPDFLVSEDPWFRPVDLKLGPDGALYVSDFYNKIIGHYEVDLKHPGRDKDRGRVWRIVYTGKKDQPGLPALGFQRKDWTQASANELLDAFGHANTTVRLMAANEAATRSSFKPKVENLLNEPATVTAKMGLAAFVCERTGEIDADSYATAFDVAVKEPDKVPPESLTGLTVRAMNSRREWREKERALALVGLTKFDSVRVKRAVIDGISAHPHESFLEPLLAYTRTIPTDDVVMRHAAKVALRNCLDAGTAVVKVPKDAKPADVRPLIDALLGCTNPASMGSLLELLKAGQIPEEQAFDAGRRLGRYADTSTWYDVFMACNHKDELGCRLGLRVMAGACRGAQERGYKMDPKKGKEDQGSHLRHGGMVLAREAMVKYPALSPLALEVYREARPLCEPLAFRSTVRHDDLLGRFLTNPASTREQRLAAAEIVLLSGERPWRGEVEKLAKLEPLNSPTLIGLIELTLADQPGQSEFMLAASALKISPYAQAVRLASGLAATTSGAELLLISIGKGEAPARLLQEKAVVDRLQATKVKDLENKMKELTKNIPPAEKRLEDLLKARAAGFPKAKTDPAQGKAVFTKNCAVCHQLNNEGAKVGPQLDGVGIRGVARLMEDTLDPSRHVDAAFRATKLDLRDGNTLTGLVREDGTVYVLVDTTGKEHRIPTADVDKKTVSNLSAMPANLDTTMTEDEYYHLLAFLIDQKPKK
ncbi:MAG: c-type cytochrome [Fimbriiglobus sp.]|jgi:putative heme-binding domain-containing protein|nr:c-type cytochrome [Fimbriiglobus sp.]